jgi:hypothetical protein
MIDLAATRLLAWWWLDSVAALRADSIPHQGGAGSN